METKKPKILVVVGPTASGKTALGVALAKKLNGEIISADSMQIYKYMNIGTAKVTLEEMQGVPHHLVDCVSPDEEFSVAKYKKAALGAIEAILSKGKLPIIIGGTGLYINSLSLPWDFQKKDSDEIIRWRLTAEAEVLGKEALYQRLKSVDPVTAESVHPNNQNRIIRALEIYELTGKPKSHFDEETKKQEVPYDYIILGLDWDRETLYHRINHRVDRMIEEGLVEETKMLVERGYDWNLTALKAIGYKELKPYLEGVSTLAEAVTILKRDSRHYAKRQMTWFRKDKRIQWLKMSEAKDLETQVEACLKLILPQFEPINESE
ncbi:tRNA (adenosine(37)-N6)-dimethylallyltransferase MiaA [Acetobacterium carbinolicum]|jgi:tRNA dimethylallyltransferase|uniref:tRNA (adenosine(37)-N6)-dimethylallyltransferase MiaA n=1 Tax=Acetobacterium TaxID=33951 RepID=UPI000DBEB354|nr:MULTISPECIES: tRNA (adenosine(37)-N6)-dimethylallyltransferase MiaA [unclassified Acetobacterium]AWW25315.1 tRNA (adenosine(37)-N6)-dimethylallyltransferase MiaA [Acetobacterium sp. KB-1]MDZ5723823.1 tRNA (adenosine(37)-N6)-dimethylallyltransferase MiaA [Acetobacterium sp. K1/6]